jgi:pimeloyl-ACP methyl ester carboxylesterase
MSANLVSQAAYLLQNGDRASACLLLAEALRQRPDDEQAWLWLSGAVESDKERLDCLQRVLAIDPGNQAALAGLQALSQHGRTGGAPGLFSASPDSALEAFLSEQESLHSISPPAPRHSPRKGTPDVCRPSPLENETAFVTPASAPTPQDGPTFEAPASNPDLDLRGLLQETPAPAIGLPDFRPASRVRSAPLAVNAFRRVRRARTLIPWRELPFSREQLLLFGLGLIIAFLSLLIGFSVLKTVLHGPRVLAAPAPLPSPTPLPTPIPEPTPLVYQPTLVSSDCRFNLPAGARVECRTAILPESRDGSSARSLRLPLVIYRSLNPFPPADPLIYLHGGPGASAIEWAAANFEGFIGPLLYERDVLVFDARGFGQATPVLDCPELLNQFHLELRQEIDLEYRAAVYGPLVKACRDRLASQGIRLAHYSSAAMAADLRDIVELLGYEQVNLYGVSFGASVAQVVARDHPEILRSLVLDSALPLQGNFYTGIAGGLERAVGALNDSCQADAACRSKYPNLQAVFNELSAKLEANPLRPDSAGSSTSRLVVDALRFQEALRLALLTPALLPDIPQGIYALRYGDTAFVEAALSAPRMYFTDPALGGMLSILCSEHAYALTPASLEAGLQADLQAYPRTAALARYSLYGGGQGLFEICDQWQAAPFQAQPEFAAASAIPTLLLNGALDPLASPALLAQPSPALEQATRVEFPNLGHALSLGPQGACPLSIALAFLHDPAADLPLACVGQ